LQLSLESVIYKWYSIPVTYFIAVIGIPFLGVLGGIILPDLPAWKILGIWLIIIIFVIAIDKIFHRKLCVFVKEEVERGSHDKCITKILSHLIKVKNNHENIIRDSEIRKNLYENPQNISRLQSKKIECILNLLKKEEWLL